MNSKPTSYIPQVSLPTDADGKTILDVPRTFKRFASPSRVTVSYQQDNGSYVVSGWESLSDNSPESVRGDNSACGIQFHYKLGIVLRGSAGTQSVEAHVTFTDFGKSDVEADATFLVGDQSESMHSLSTAKGLLIDQDRAAFMADSCRGLDLLDQNGETIELRRPDGPLSHFFETDQEVLSDQARYSIVLEGGHRREEITDSGQLSFASTGNFEWSVSPSGVSPSVFASHVVESVEQVGLGLGT